MQHPTFSTIPELLLSTAERFPERGFHHVRPDKSLYHYSYPELLSRALQLLAGLQRKGLKQGDKVILALDHSQEIIPVLWASFFGGLVPALLQPPVTFSEYNPAAEKAGKVRALLGKPWIIYSSVHAQSWLKSGVDPQELIDVGSIDDASGDPYLPHLQSDDLALIQFSSGSTGDPKGVMLSHRNILSNIGDIVEGIALTEKDVSVSWMPLYHDMGLIGFHITPTMIGCPQYFIEPVDFVKNPGLYLDAMSRYRCNITGCPNFGQILVNRYLNRRNSFECDLSSVRVVFNGAEPISIPVMQEFNRLLSRFSYTSTAMFPAYGMAEATLAVTFASLNEPPHLVSFQRKALLEEGRAILHEKNSPDASANLPDIIQLVNLGKPLTHCSILLVDEDLNPVSEGVVGQILVQGAQVTSGYYHDPLQTAEALQQGWLHTGDLGFVYDGDLFVMGRLKDVIFINGINLYAHDLEQMVLSLKEVPDGKLVMAGYFDEQEGRDKVILFMVAPPNEASRTLFRRIQQVFLQSIGLLVDTFIPIRSADIPRTSSGKIQRYKLVNRFLKGEFQKMPLE